MFRMTAALLLAFAMSVMPAFAAEPEVGPGALATAVAPPLAGDAGLSLVPVEFGGPSRGTLLPALYVGLAGLNAFDAYTTSWGVAHGAVEANAMMRGVASNAPALWAVKGSITAGTIIVAERLWRQNRRASAIAVMVLSNGMMAVVAARNASVIRQLR